MVIYAENNYAYFMKIPIKIEKIPFFTFRTSQVKIIFLKIEPGKYTYFENYNFSSTPNLIKTTKKYAVKNLNRYFVTTY